MNISATTKTKVKTIAIISMIGIIIGILFAVTAFSFTWYRFFKGAVIGLLITSVSSIIEIFYFSELIKKSNFVLTLAARITFYIIWISFSILLVLFIFDSIQEGRSFFDVVNSNYVKKFLINDFFIILLFSVSVSFVINFLHQIVRILGGRLILNLLIGRYIKPSAETRIFMFLDLKSSTRIAEKLDSILYSQFLQDFFLDIADPIEEEAGQIYQYVGDEVVITWPLNDVNKDDRCIRCFFKIHDKITERSDYYLEKYGQIPEFKAGIHAGKAVVTEVGDLQKEIVYHGDVLNTASRIQYECNRLDENLLVSEALIRSIEIDPGYKIGRMGVFFLKGKNRRIVLYRVTRPQLV